MNSLDCGTQAHPTWFACLRLDGLGSATGGDRPHALVPPYQCRRRTGGGHMLGHGFGLLAFFGPTLLQSGAERGEQRETGLLRRKDTIGGAAQSGEAVSS
jgi:hypothetical protein